MKEISYGVREFQARIGQALRAVERGERVLITSRGRPIATLSKPDRSVKALPPFERKLRRLAAEGKLVLGRRAPIADYTPPRVKGVAAQILADRR